MLLAIQYITTCTDYYRPELLQQVLEAVADLADWEREVIIAAEAVYAENFLNRN